MQGIKLTALILGGVAAVGTAVFCFTVFSFIQESSVAERVERALYEPLIPAFGASCDIPDGAASQTYSVTIKSPDVTETKIEVEALAQLHGGEIEYDSEYTNFVRDTSRPATRSANVSLLLPLEESEEFVAELKTMKLPGYLVFEDENTRYESASSLRQRCRSFSGTLSKLQSEEKLYLNQLKESPTEELIDKISDVREGAFSQSRVLSDEIMKLLDTAKITITIEELLG